MGVEMFSMYKLYIGFQRLRIQGKKKEEFVNYLNNFMLITYISTISENSANPGLIIIIKVKFIPLSL